MKYAPPIIIVLLLISMISVMFLSMGEVQKMTVVYEGNFEKLPIWMEVNHYQDSECGMIIDELSFASQVVAPDGKTWFFHDHGGMVAWLKNKPFRDEAVIWVHDLTNGGWIDGRKAWYSRTDNTPMMYGFGAYSEKLEGFIDFPTMQKHMLKGETLANPATRNQLLGE